MEQNQAKFREITPHLRWNNGVLEQLYKVWNSRPILDWEYDECGWEWRSVPQMKQPAPTGGDDAESK